MPCAWPLFLGGKIRAMAAELDLPTQARKDSQGICFLGKLRYDTGLDCGKACARIE